MTEQADTTTPATAKKKAAAKKKAPAKSSPPPCPPVDPSLGDKTPAVVAWYAEHDPEGYKKKYERLPTDENPPSDGGGIGQTPLIAPENPDGLPVYETTTSYGDAGQTRHS